MGAVYEGEHTLIKRRVAIKCLHAQMAKNPEIVARFHREAQAATSIGHENIIEVTDMGRFDDGSVFMVLEFLEGSDWGDELRADGAQNLKRTIHILNQVCDALDAAHSKGIIHRDLKPENIFLIDRSGKPDFVKVLDFGISKIKDASGAGKSMTQTGTTLGTPYYMSPEQAQGKKDVDFRTDIYALGVILFEALTGQFPFDDDSYPMLVLKICTEPPPALRDYRPDVPEEIEAIVNKLLEKSPRDRFQSCAELKAALAPFAEVDDTPRLASNAPSTKGAPSSVLEEKSTFAAKAGAKSAAMAKGTAAAVPAARTAERLDSFRPAPGLKETYAPGPETQLGLSKSSKSNLGLAVVGVLLAIFAMVGLSVLFSGDDEPEPVPVVATVEPEEASTEEAAPERVDVNINVVDESGAPLLTAALLLDGERVPNPFRGQLPRQEGARRLEARMEGFQSVIEDFNLNYGGDVTLRMERGEGTDDRRASAMRSSMRPTMRSREVTQARMDAADRIGQTPSMQNVAPSIPVGVRPPSMDPSSLDSSSRAPSMNTSMRVVDTARDVAMDAEQGAREAGEAARMGILDLTMAF